MSFLSSVFAKAAGFKWSDVDKAWTRKTVAGTSLGAAGAMSALGQVFGISAVVHSSGGLILTGSSGYIYIAWTFLAPLVAFFAWIVWPLLVFVALVAIFWKWTSLPFVKIKKALNLGAGWVQKKTSDTMD